MLNGANTLNYNLYMDAARTVVWGDKSSGTSNYTALLAALPVTLSVYGRIPARQNAKAGNFADTVVITLLF
jgi:spore coat protein U-like protein